LPRRAKRGKEDERERNGEHEYPRSGGKGVGQMEVEPISVITL